MRQQLKDQLIEALSTHVRCDYAPSLMCATVADLRRLAVAEFTPVEPALSDGMQWLSAFQDLAWEVRMSCLIWRRGTLEAAYDASTGSIR
jgi:hypothetical protein